MIYEDDATSLTPGAYNIHGFLEVTEEEAAGAQMPRPDKFKRTCLPQLILGRFRTLGTRQAPGKRNFSHRAVRIAGGWSGRKRGFTGG